MAITTTELFLVAMLLILAVPYLFWRLLKTDRYAPLVVVQIIAGILLGPGVLGVLAPAAHSALFTPPVIGALNGIAWWAVMLFVWVAGLELDLRQAWQKRLDTGLTATFALAMPFLFGCGAAWLLVASGSGWSGGAAESWQVITGIGLACAVSALPILILLMDKLAILRQPLGQRVLRYASLDDIAVWGVLALVLVDWERAGRQLGFLMAFAIASFLFRKLMIRLDRSDRWPVGLVWLTVVSLAADWAGLHFMVGAFLAGAILDSDWLGSAAVDRFRDVVLMTIMPVFFLSTGLRTEWGVGGTTVFAAATLLLAAAIGGKLLGVTIAGRLLGWRKGDAWAIGWLLQTKALITIIFANVLLDRGVISTEAFTALLLMAVASTMLTVPMIGNRLSSKDKSDAP